MLKKTVEIYTMSVSNVQEWSVKVSNRLDNYLRCYDNLKSTKTSPFIIMRPTNSPPRPEKFFVNNNITVPG